MTIAHNIEAQAANWFGGSAGSGCLFRGNNGLDDDCGYVGAGTESGTGRNTKARHILSNGEEIWDFSGNVWEWVDWSLGGALTLGPTTCPAVGWQEWPDVACGALASTDYMSNNPSGQTASAYNSDFGLGKFYAGAVGAARRGGWRGDQTATGAFTLSLNFGGTSVQVGFRCVLRRCPAGYIPVIPNPTVGTNSEFCVMKYEAKNVGGIASSQAAGNPWVNINADNSLLACQANGARYDLISNGEWMTIAREIEANNSNWDGGVLSRGWSASTVSDGFQNTAVAPSTDAGCLYNTVADTCGATGDHTLKRTHALFNNQEIWDFAGNVWELVDWEVETPNTASFTLGPTGCIENWQEVQTKITGCSGQTPNLGDPLPATSILASPFDTNLSSVENIGQIYGGSGGVVARGGSWGAGAYAGAFALNSSMASTSTSTGVGFRCVHRHCPAGYIPVPANPVVGTTADFCVMKYEAKNVGGVATSQAAGIPWGSINQTDSKTACTALGVGYDLISNPEWMTIAYNVEATASNWDGGVVGSSALYRGHTDDVPASVLAVSNTTDFYSDTGNNAGEAMGSGKEQRRTFTLSNGEIVWDLAGNIWEWTDWTLGGAIDSGPTSCTGAWTEFPVVSCGALVAADYMADNPAGLTAADYNANYGLGRFYGGSGGAAVRSGYWSNGPSAGVFTLSLNFAPTNTSPNIGFRCVFRP